MPNVSRASIAHVLERAAKTITDAAGTDGRASRADVTKKLKELTGTEKTLVDTFYRFMDHRDAKAGASVTKKDIAAALTEAKTKLVNAYDLDANGLSADERVKMGQVGQLAATIAETFRSPTYAARDAVAVLVSPKWKADALPVLDPSELSSSARKSFDAKAKSATRSEGLIDQPIARKLTAGGEQFTVVAQFMHDSFGIELYNANGRRVAHGSGWGTPDQPIEWK
ncbi:MAG: hypothetical protein U0228_10225 [Myxococcaceae bacterium]